MKRVTGVIGRHRVLSGIVVLVAAVGGVFVFRQVEPIVVAQFDDVSFAVPKAPELTAKSGEQLFRIDPKLSKDVTTITLSYTFFEVGGKTPAAPADTADASVHVSPVNKVGS